MKTTDRRKPSAATETPSSTLPRRPSWLPPVFDLESPVLKCLTDLNAPALAAGITNFAMPPVPASSGLFSTYARRHKLIDASTANELRAIEREHLRLQSVAASFNPQTLKQSAAEANERMTAEPGFSQNRLKEFASGPGELIRNGATYRKAAKQATESHSLRVVKPKCAEVLRHLLRHAEAMLLEIKNEERRLAEAEGREFTVTNRQIEALGICFRIAHQVEAAASAIPLSHSPRSLLAGVLDLNFLDEPAQAAG